MIRYRPISKAKQVQCLEGKPARKTLWRKAVPNRALGRKKRGGGMSIVVVSTSFINFM